MEKEKKKKLQGITIILEKAQFVAHLKCWFPCGMGTNSSSFQIPWGCLKDQGCSS